MSHDYTRLKTVSLYRTELHQWVNSTKYWYTFISIYLSMLYSLCFYHASNKDNRWTRTKSWTLSLISFTNNPMDFSEKFRATYLHLFVTMWTYNSKSLCRSLPAFVDISRIWKHYEKWWNEAWNDIIPYNGTQ